MKKSHFVSSGLSGRSSYSNFSNYPEAFITVNKSRRKIYDNNKVYLNDGDEFEVELCNSGYITYGAEISLNGVQISNRLVLKPGERIFLERYFDSNDKFKFNIYSVKDTEQNREAIEKNGEIVIRFFAEKINYSITYSPSPLVGAQESYFTCQSDMIYDSTTAFNSIETGRIEKGSKSDQMFVNADISFESLSCYTVSYKILPYSQKVITTDDTKTMRTYCPNCGVKSKGRNANYCWKCGSKL